MDRFIWANHTSFELFLTFTCTLCLIESRQTLGVSQNGHMCHIKLTLLSPFRALRIDHKIRDRSVSASADIGSRANRKSLRLTVLSRKPPERSIEIKQIKIDAELNLS